MSWQKSCKFQAYFRNGEHVKKGYACAERTNRKVVNNQDECNHGSYHELSVSQRDKVEKTRERKPENQSDRKGLRSQEHTKTEGQRQ